MSTELWLILGVLTGAVGMGYFVYGKKQSRPVPLVAGILLSVYPWFVDSALWFVVIGLVLITAPFVIRWEP